MGIRTDLNKVEGERSRLRSKRAYPSVGRLMLVAAPSLGLALALYVGLSHVPAVTHAVTDATAGAVGLILRSLGTGVSVRGSVLDMTSVQFVVAPECTPLAPVMLLAGAMVAFPIHWRAKLFGVLLGALVLNALNLVRIVSLVYVGIYVPQWLEVAHAVVGQGAMILAGVLVFLWWMRGSVREVHE